MEKNRIRPVKSGRTFRMSYSKSNEVLEIPNLIAIQKDSYQWFLGDGLKEVFDDISPIVDFSGNLELRLANSVCARMKLSTQSRNARNVMQHIPHHLRLRSDFIIRKLIPLKNMRFILVIFR